jgi:hypothetical protein
MEYQKSSVGFTTDGGPKIIDLIYRLKFKINRLNQNGKPDVVIYRLVLAVYQLILYDKSQIYKFSGFIVNHSIFRFTIGFV